MPLPAGGELLSGLRVLDLTRVLAGPFATSILADLGANVIKIESPKSPDGLRSTPPFVNGVSNHFMNINRNKQSLALDLRTDRGKELFMDLVRDADVVVENYRPGIIAKMGLGYEALAAVNERELRRRRYELERDRGTRRGSGATRHPHG